MNLKDVDPAPLDPGVWLDPVDRAALHRALAISQEDFEAGRLVDAEEVLRKPGLQDAPVDDEPPTAEEEQALAEAERDLAEGRLVSHAEARRRLGLSRPGGA